MRDKSRKILGCCLRNGVEEGVPTADVRRQRMLGTYPISKLDVMMITRASAVGLISARGEERTVQTELHVEHRDLLVDHHLEPRGRSCIEQVHELIDIQVVRCGHAHGTPFLEQRDGQRIGGIEREIRDEPDSSFQAIAQSAGIAHQDAIGTTFDEEVENVAFARFFDARRRQVDGGIPPSRGRDGLVIFLDVLIVGVDGLDSARNGPVDLVGPSTQHRQLDRGSISVDPGRLPRALDCDRLEKFGDYRFTGDRPDGSGRGRCVQLRDQIPAQPVQQAHRDHRPPIDRQIESAELVDRPSQPSELSREQSLVRRSSLRTCEGLVRFDRDALRGCCHGRESQRFARDGSHLDIDTPFAARRPFERAPQSSAQLRIVGLPDLLSDPEPSQVDRIAAEPQLNPAGELGTGLGRCPSRTSLIQADHFVDAAALLVAADRRRRRTPGHRRL